MKYLLVFTWIIGCSFIVFAFERKKVRPEKVCDLVCFWDFSEKANQSRVSKKSPFLYALREGGKPIQRVKDGIFGKWSANVTEGDWFYISGKDCPALNIHGKDAQVTVVAWIKRGKKSFSQCEAIAGIWNETNKKRQYCLFMDLRIWKSSQQVGGHISGVGGPTDGYKYCMDASIGQTTVPFDEWQCIGFTYDGEKACSYLNGKLDLREGRNPYPYNLGLYDGGAGKSDFTVGAVDRSGEMGNFFVGKIGGLAVYNRALTPKEMEYLASNIANK